MDATVNCSKPVIIVGAMRPSTAISADGPSNLLEAVTLAVSPAARDRGGLVVLNDRIGQAWYTEKTNANTLDTFQGASHFRCKLLQCRADPGDHPQPSNRAS